LSVYTHDGPVSGPGRYHGRQALVRSLVSGAAQGRSFAVCGGPKLGRSSTLGQLAHLAELKWQRDPGALKLVPVRYDLTRLGAAGPKTLVKSLWTEITTAVLNARVFGDGEPVRAPDVDFLRADEPWQALAAACTELWDRLSGTPGWCQWVLLLEGADQLLSPKLESELSGFAALITSGASGAPSSVVVEGGRLLREMLFEVHTPLKFLRPMFLGLLRDSEAEALARSGFPEADDLWLRSILAATGKHPYLMQRLLAQLEVLGVGATVEQALDAIQADVAGLFEAVWHEFDLDRGVTYRGAYAAPEHALMQYTLDSGGEMRLRLAERDLGIKPLKEYAEFLEYVGAVERVLRADEAVYVAPCEMFNSWYADRVLR